MSNQAVYFKNIRNIIIEALETSNFEILIAVAWLTDETIIKVLNELSLRGIKISIIFFDDRINNKNLFKTLYYRNAELKASKKLMHNKFCVIDKKIVINGSYNWTYNASTNDENIQITKDNNDLVNSFVEEFNDLKKNCKDLDSHFKYSKSEISQLESEFQENIKIHAGKYKFPYFKSINNFNANKIHYAIKSNNNYIIHTRNEINGFVFINDKNDEYNFYRYIYYLEKDYSLTKITNATSQDFKFPSFFYNIIGLEKKLDINNINKNEYTVEKPIKGYSGKAGDVYLINCKGEAICEKFRYSEKLSNGFYVGRTNHTILNQQLKEIKFNGHLKEFVEGAGIVSRYYVPDKDYKYGFTDLNSNILVGFEYDNYKIIGKNIIEFYEKPIGFSNFSNYYNLTTVDKYYTSENGCYKIHLFNFETSEIKISNQIFNSENNIHYFFGSEDNYNYRDFYEQCCGVSITLVKFLEIKEDFFRNSGSSANSKLKYAIFLRELYSYKLVSVKDKKAQDQKACYIATMVYKDINHPNVESLRQFRDSKLNKFFIGQLFINYYYEYSPNFVNKMKNCKKTNYLIKKILDSFVKIIK